MERQRKGRALRQRGDVRSKRYIAIPAEYDPNYHIVHAAIYAGAGMSITQICELFGLSPTAMAKWRTKYPELDEAITHGRLPIDWRVEGALINNALGYWSPATYEVTYKQTILLDENGQEVHDEDGQPIYVASGERVVKETRKYVEPKQQAIEFWLSNRRPDKWQRGGAPTGTGTSEVALELSPEDVATIRAEIRKDLNMPDGQTA